MAENKVTTPCEMVVIGGSSGSIDVLLKLLPALRIPLNLTVLIVLHRKNTADSTLAHLLSLKTLIPCREIDDKDRIEPGNIYLAPADYHVLVEQNRTFSLDDSEKVHYSRPSIDVTFESAADVYGPALVGILLSGANADGTNGLNAIGRAGGITVVQSPASAQVAFMPQQAILSASVDSIFDTEQLAPFINSLPSLADRA